MPRLLFCFERSAETHLCKSIGSAYIMSSFFKQIILEFKLFALLNILSVSVSWKKS
jgi:hypothetical protein